MEHNFPILSLLVFTPLAGALALMFFGRDSHRELRHSAFAVSLLTFLLSLGMLVMYQDAQSRVEQATDAGKFKLAELADWIPSLGVHYHLAIDGISILLVLLTTLLTPLILLSSWRAIEGRVKEFQICFLILESGMLGAFLAMDLVLFYAFWEIMLVPMYVLIGVWGGERRIYAALKFFIYTMAGSLPMLIAILYIGNVVGSFQIPDILLAIDTPTGAQRVFSESAQCWLFAAFALSFAVKVPLFPLHTWLPDAHVEAPTAGSVVLAGVLLKFGTYGFIRFAIPFFPAAVDAFTPFFLWVSVVGIVFGACMALVQTDIKKLVAYSSVSHMGIVVIGLFAFDIGGLALSGSIIQMVNHGLSTGMLFLLIGIIYERRHTREISNYGGLAQTVPVFAVMFMIATFSSIGLPGLNGFIGEILILLGTFAEHRTIAVLAATGVVLGAVYMLTLAKRFLFGPVVVEENRGIADIRRREFFYLSPIVILMVWIGLYPKPFTNLIKPSVERYVQQHKHQQYLLEATRSAESATSSSSGN